MFIVVYPPFPSREQRVFCTCYTGIRGITVEGASKSYVLSVNSLECGKRWHPDPLSSGVYTVQVLRSAPLRPSERGAGGGVLRPAFIRGLYRYCRRRLCVPAKGVREAVALGMCDSDC